jgi:ankyrin repeat protein
MQQYIPVILKWSNYWQTTDIRCNDDSLLITASKIDNVEMIIFLIDMGCDINQKCDHIVNEAIYRGNLNIIKYLVNIEFEHVIIRHDNLLTAIRRNALNIIPYMIDLGVDIRANKDIALLTAAIDYQQDIVRLLINQGANIHACDDMPLYNTVKNGCLELTQFLVDSGANHNIDAFLTAVKYGHLHICKYLLSIGVEVSDISNLFKIVTGKGYLDILRLLVDINSQVNITKDIVLSIIKYDNLEILKFLMGHGADIDSWKEELIKYAVTHNSQNIVDYLNNLWL